MTNTSPEDQTGAPARAPNASAVPRWTADLLHEHEAIMQWELLTSPHLVALYHKNDCDQCITYLGHLTQGVRAGELGSQPSNLESAMEKAWLGFLKAVCEDATRELAKDLDQADQSYDKLKKVFYELRLDYDTLWEDLREEQVKLQDAEEWIACYKGKYRTTPEAPTRYHAAHWQALLHRIQCALILPVV